MKNGTMPKPTDKDVVVHTYGVGMHIPTLSEESVKPLTERTKPIDPNLFPIVYVPPEEFKYPGRPDTTSPIQVEPEPEVQEVIACSSCGLRKYMALTIPRAALNRVYCSFCKAQKVFKVLTKEEWDAYAGGSNGPTEHS